MVCDAPSGAGAILVALDPPAVAPGSVGGAESARPPAVLFQASQFGHLYQAGNSGFIASPEGDVRWIPLRFSMRYMIELIVEQMHILLGRFSLEGWTAGSITGGRPAPKPESADPDLTVIVVLSAVTSVAVGSWYPPAGAAFPGFDGSGRCSAGGRVQAGRAQTGRSGI